MKKALKVNKKEDNKVLKALSSGNDKALFPYETDAELYKSLEKKGQTALVKLLKKYA